MEQFELNAEPRTDKGKGASRRLRRAGKLPGIVYGTDREAQPIMLAHDDLVHHLEREAFFSHILTLAIGGKREKVVLKDLQRHPFRPIVMHIDFQRIDETQELTMRIPIHFINEAECVGVKTGGAVVSRIMTEVEVSCLPKDLPEYIEVDVGPLNIGDTVHLSDLKLPPGVSIYAMKHGGDGSQTVASVHIPRAIEIEEEVPAEAAVAAVPGAEVPAGEAAPAAQAAAPEAEAKEEGKDKEKGKGKGKE
ncbi:MAG TPA: 50S ribosomal protein L25/general stress protein Ctc [Gammaproteobacteria bacterium]